MLGREREALAAAGKEEAGPSLLMVGPEGDFTRREVQLLEEAGALPVGLGPHRLRVETAAISLLNCASMFAEGSGLLPLTP